MKSPVAGFQRRSLIAIALSCLLLIAACDGTQGPSAVEVPPLPECVGTENLLSNPTFGQGEGDRLAPWRGSQHAGETSFALTVENGELTIERIGPEPWYALTQFIPPEPLKGHRLLFVADLKLELSDEGWTEIMTPGGGLSVSVWAASPVAMAGDRLVLDSTFDHEPHLGETDWFTAHKTVVVPDNATKLRVGFVHRAMGRFALREARLFDCGPAVSTAD